MLDAHGMGPRDKVQGQSLQALDTALSQWDFSLSEVGA